MHLNRLVLRNFKKFRRADLEFSDGLTGIVGSNGAGKSTIVEAIAWALYGNRASGIKRDFIRNSRSRDSDGVEVSLTISLGRQELVIYRAMKGKGLSAEAHLSLDGQMIAIGSKEVDGKLEEILKISYQDFMKTFYARQKDLDNLLKEGAAGKREYLLKLLGLDDIKEHAVDLIKIDKASLEAERNRLAGALMEMADVSVRLEKASHDILEAKRGLDEAERSRAALALAEEVKSRALEAFEEKMRRNGLLSERKGSLEDREAELKEKAVYEQSRLNAIDLSKKRLLDIQPLLEKLAGIRARLDILDPKRAAFEESARRIASIEAALKAERRSLEEGRMRLLGLEKDASERDVILPGEEEYRRLEERIVALEDLRDRHRDLQAAVMAEVAKEQSTRVNLSRAISLRADLLLSRKRLQEIAGCHEEEQRRRQELTKLTRQMQMQKELVDLLSRKAGIDQRLAERKVEAQAARGENDALGEIDEKEALLLRWDSDLDRLNSDLSRVLSDLRGSYKVAESALAEAERSLRKVEALGEEVQCPTCERPLQGQRDLLIGKYELSAGEARMRMDELAAEIKAQKEKMEDAARSRSSLRAAFDQLNAQKSRRAALRASLKGLAIQIHDLASEQKEIAAKIDELGLVEFNASKLEEVEAALKSLHLLVAEHAALSLRLEALPGLEKEIIGLEVELATSEARQADLASRAEALGFQEADFLEAKKRAASLKPLHDRFLALTERVTGTPALRDKCKEQEQEAAALDGSLQSLIRSQRELGYSPSEYEQLFKEKKELSAAEREKEEILRVMAGECEASDRLASLQAAQEKLNADLEKCQAQIISLSYQIEEHEKAKADLAGARGELERARAAHSERQVQVGVLQAARQRLLLEAERKAELEGIAAGLARRLEVVDVTRLLVNSFMDQVLIRVKNDIARTAGEILDEVSGKYSLIKIDDDFNILVEDGSDWYPISRFSGGEIDMIAVSVRVAISEYLMRFGPDGESYSFLILDEVFGSQDQEHREKMIQMLRSLEERFPQIIAISHISDVQGQFDNTLLVVEDELGNSRVEAI